MMKKKDADPEDCGAVTGNRQRHRAQRGRKRFVALVRRYTAIEELTYENVHEFIDRILIHELDKETNTRKSKSFIALSAELIQATSLLKVSPISDR